MIESPKPITAGIETFGGSFTRPFVLIDKTNNNIKRSIKLIEEQFRSFVNTAIYTVAPFQELLPRAIVLHNFSPMKQ